MRRSAIPLVLLVIYWLIALTSTHWPRPVAPQLMELGLDKIAHFLIYAVLATLLVVAWPAKSVTPARQGWRQSGRYLAVWTIAAGYGVIDELTQPWFGRHCDIWDWVADASGALTAILVCAWFVRRRRQQGR
jgi:VanZ family protein